jgi:hypothetical protein
LARLYIDMFKCRCGVIVSSRPSKGGSDIEGCQYCVERRFRGSKIVHVRRPWQSFDAHVRMYNGLLHLADRIWEGRDLFLEIARLRDGVPAWEVRRLGSRSAAASLSTCRDAFTKCGMV